MSPEVKYVDDDFNVVEQGRILRARIVYCGIKIVIHVVYGPGQRRKSLPPLPSLPPLKIEKNAKSLEILRVFEIFSGFLGVCPP